MVRIFFPFIFIAVFLSGCASSLKKEVHSLEYDLQQSNTLIRDAKTSLAENPDVYDGENCFEPKRGLEPKFSCHTAQQAKETALASCAISYKGCDAVVELYSNELDSASERFLASQACEAMLAEMQGGSLDPGRVIVDGITAYAKDRCENGGFFGKLFTCPYAIAGEIVKFADFTSCVDKQSTMCLENYQNWKNGPSRRKVECESNLATISREADNVAATSRLLRKKKSSFMWKLFGD